MFANCPIQFSLENQNDGNQHSPANKPAGATTEVVGQMNASGALEFRLRHELNSNWPARQLIILYRVYVKCRLHQIVVVIDMTMVI